MKIYAACLASYNAGILHGAWLEVSSDPEEMREAVAAMLAASPTEGAEEYAIHDYDDFPNMGEYPGLDAVAAMAAIFEDYDHIAPGDLLAILDDFREPGEAREALDDRYIGIFNTFQDYADEFADEMLACEGHKGDSIAARYFDYEAFARDLAFDMRTVDCPSGVAVFHA